ncbi:unnamed protein product [Schistosoma guineensis]|uniref:Uncharacterized protein n=1 Tax=Schistosoma margrebowiei TaxID=48269 RepID=A0AA84ZM55_9TREM|nr:unnamed protein product [Schistosoma bovis]CAH8467994.1 unnamed protein product [Schistosoma guineensis]CAH8471975.1 unnamed protein product [Schistosoma margrebowiei]
MIASPCRTLHSLFNKYCLCLAIYMCEPWEKVILHCITLAIICALTYTTVLIVPSQLSTLIIFVWKCLNGDTHWHSKPINNILQ